MSRSKLGEMFHPEGPRDTPVQQGLQLSDFQTKRCGRPFMPVEACQHETDPLVRFEPEVHRFR